MKEIEELMRRIGEEKKDLQEEFRTEDECRRYLKKIGYPEEGLEGYDYYQLIFCIWEDDWVESK